jgi:DNA-binding SARP family transcriptional activator/tetratricopeptide (TPR) repeat protein
MVVERPDLHIGVLGPLEVVRDGERVDLPAGQMRTLLAALLVPSGHVVSVDVLAHRLWPDQLPVRARAAVHTYVARLRRRLGRDAIHTGSGGGYQLVLATAQVDLWQFRELLRRAEAAGSPEVELAMLQQALGLWRGRPFVDVASTWLDREVVPGLIEERVAAVERRMDLEQATVPPGRLVPELRELIAMQPSRESLWRRLIEALYHLGRRVEALDAYQEVRTVLAEEFGLDPSDALQQLHRAILLDGATAPAPVVPEPAVAQSVRQLPHDIASFGGRREAHLRVVRGEIPSPVRAGVRSAPPVPAQLPADVAGFTGRTAEESRLDTLLTDLRVAERDGQVPPVVIAAIHGTAGVGKTALAVHWAHRVRDAFPDGQLFANLRGFDSAQPPTQSCTVLGWFLRALGVDPIPHDVAERAARYRSAVAGRRVLIVLDNAATAEQVRPLLPGTSTCLVLVTSRNRLGGLVAVNGAVHVPVATLSSSDAIALLENLVGHARVKAEATHAAELARLCGYIPLALRLAASELRLRPQRPIAGAVTALSGQHRLGALEIVGDHGTGVRAAVELSYLALPAEQQQLFRRLGIIPGPDFTPMAATPLLDGPSEEHVTKLLDQLIDANLVESQYPGRYRLHDLIRLYARERCDTDEAATTTEELLAGLLEWYLASTRAAGKPLYAHFQYLADHTETPSDAFADPAAALAWLDAENVNVTAAIHEAAGQTDPRAAWLLADAVSGYFMIRADNYDEWLTGVHTGLRAATRAGDARAQAAMQLSAGVSRWCTSAPRGLLDHSARALDLARQARWPVGEAAALTHLGQAHAALGNAREALEFVEEALPRCQELASVMGTTHNLIVRGFAQCQLGELTAAVNSLTTALALAREHGLLMAVCVAQHALGEAYRQLGRWHEARECHNASMAAGLAHGMRYRQAHNLAALAEVARHLDEHDTAMALIQEAVAVARKARDRAGEANVLAIAGRITAHLDDYSFATEQHREARDIAHDVGLRHVEAQALIGIAAARSAAGAYLEAMSAAREALAITEPASYQVLTGQALTVLAENELARGDASRAEALAKEALELHGRTGHRPGVARVQRVLSVLSEA